MNTTEFLVLGTMGLIVAHWKFGVPKTSIVLGFICFKNIKFPRGNYQPIVPRQKHTI